MKQFILIFILLFSCISLFAQDIITLRNGDEIRARITEVSPTEIRYRQFENLSGAVWVLPISDVFFINYENGTREVFDIQTNITETPVMQVTSEQPTQNQHFTPQIVRAQNPVSNIRIWRDDLNTHRFQITYNLSERADIEVLISFDNGVNYLPLSRTRGDAGRRISAGNNKSVNWDGTSEFGFVDFSNVLFKISATPVINPHTHISEVVNPITPTSIPRTASVVISPSNNSAVLEGNIISNVRVRRPACQCCYAVFDFDLSERADVRFFVSFNEGVTYRPLRRTNYGNNEIIRMRSGNRSVLWNTRNELGRRAVRDLDFSTAIFKIVAEPR